MRVGFVGMQPPDAAIYVAFRKRMAELGYRDSEEIASSCQLRASICCRTRCFSAVFSAGGACGGARRRSSPQCVARFPFIRRNAPWLPGSSLRRKARPTPPHDAPSARLAIRGGFDACRSFRRSTLREPQSWPHRRSRRNSIVGHQHRPRRRRVASWQWDAQTGRSGLHGKVPRLPWREGSW